MNTKLELGILIFFAVATLFAFTWIVITEKRLKKFFLGKKAKDLEDTIVMMQEETEKLLRTTERMKNEIGDINQKLRKSIRGLETIRFNPFPDQGSNQSFAVGMLNEDGDGVVFSSLYSRERMSVFAKPVKGHKSEYELSAEEKDAIGKAKVN